MWRDENGNLHFRDEDGNYMIDAQTNVQSQTSEERTTTRDEQTASQQERGTTAGESGLQEEGLPSTAGELPLLQLVGMLSLLGAGAARLLHPRR
jgi:hypothetical protein